MLEWVLIGAVLAVAAWFVYNKMVLPAQQTRALQRDGAPALAEVLSIEQTGVVINEVPQMRMSLRMEQAGAPSRVVTVQQTIDLGSIPRMGERVCVSVDRTDPNRVAYVGPLAAFEARLGENQGKLGEFSPQQVVDLLGISQKLLNSGKPGVGTVLSVEPASLNVTRLTLELDSCVEPRRVVTVEQALTGTHYVPGDRAYVFLDPDDRNSVAMMPLSLSGGQKLDPRHNRLDALVLGPQLLHEGRKGTATVLEATQRTVAGALTAAAGAQKWQLRVRIVPEDGSTAFEAEQTLTFLTTEKVDRMARVGCEVPVRMDWNDRTTWATDSLALGYPDPYQEVLALYEAARERAGAQREVPPPAAQPAGLPAGSAAGQASKGLA